jgi:hypothetical protein
VKSDDASAREKFSAVFDGAGADIAVHDRMQIAVSQYNERRGFVDDPGAVGTHVDSGCGDYL